MKAKYILAAVFSAALLSSCSDFLDVQKEGDPTTTQYFNVSSTKYKCLKIW
ncbi:hypothetical protein [Leyella stercorea]|uniref:hypothetical protein n=1 Tax=Leyella stercorea TaxID=363265 RepID=UPI002FE1D1A2